jgi:hypothetical protein
MTNDLFIKSCAKDVEWLKYSLRSIQKFCTGFRDVVLLFPKEEKDALVPLNLKSEKVHYTLESGDRYLWQQVEKLRAYAYSDAQFFTYVDSDVVFTKPVCPKDLFFEGKPIILYTPYSVLVKKDGTPDTPWQPITEAALKRPVEYEFMRRHPMTANRYLLMEFQAFMRGTHGKEPEDYIMEQKNRAFSEFNALFAFDYYDNVCHERSSHFFNTEPPPIPPPVARQFWSWSGVGEDERRQMEEILK